MRLLQIALLVVTLLPTAASAQPIEERRISFRSGESGTTLEGRLVGGEIIDYLLGASAAQTMSIDFAPSNPSAYFNLIQGAGPEAIFVGSTSGNQFRGVLPATGDYRIRVYLMRNAARRGETSDFTLSVSIGGVAQSRVGAPEPDPEQ